jgi:CRISPR-associated protein (TIGR02710 family)
MVSKEQQPFFRALLQMVIGYDLWDRFKHSDAKKYLHKSKEILTALGAERKEMRGLANRIDTNIEFLERLLEGRKPSLYYFRDLLANAKRRAELELKYDDAVARLYRAIEVLPQTELREAFGIDTSNVKSESIPVSLREEFVTKYQQKEERKIKIPLYAAYSLLYELGSNLGREFFKIYEEQIMSLLDIRNSSILAHGFNPVDEKVFQKLFGSIMEFSGTEANDLPTFPILKI